MTLECVNKTVVVMFDLKVTELRFFTPLTSGSQPERLKDRIDTFSDPFFSSNVRKTYPRVALYVAIRVESEPSRLA